MFWHVEFMEMLSIIICLYFINIYIVLKNINVDIFFKEKVGDYNLRWHVAEWGTTALKKIKHRYVGKGNCCWAGQIHLCVDHRMCGCKRKKVFPGNLSEDALYCKHRSDIGIICSSGSLTQAREDFNTATHVTRETGNPPVSHRAVMNLHVAPHLASSFLHIPSLSLHGSIGLHTFWRV